MPFPNRSFLWELPQTALGHLLRAWMRARGRVVGERPLSDRLLVETRDVAVSLGRVVFWVRSPDVGVAARVTLAHELGHAVQSRRLGPAYLIVVGAPSIARVLRVRASAGAWRGYYDGWPEAAADRLGGIVRDDHGRRRIGASPAHADLDVRALDG